jgi:cyclin-dependent kinase 8/11
MCLFCLFLSQVSSGAALAGNMPGGHVSNRSVPRPMNVGMQRMHQLQAYNLTSQAGMGSGINPAGIPMQRGVQQQAHQQQQVYCLLGKEIKCYLVVLFMVNLMCYCCFFFDS